MCDPCVEEHFLTAIPQSSRRNIQPCVIRCIDFEKKFIFIDWHKCGLHLNISTDLSHSSESITELCFIEV